MERTAMYAGSFDPLSNGHLNIIERASTMFDSLTIGVVANVSKTPMFSLEQRVNIVREATKHIPNVYVESFSGLLADYVNSKGFTALVRGLRSASDFDYEVQMAQMNAKLFNNTESVFLMTDPKNSYISSSLIKEVANLGGDVSQLVPESVLKEINNKLNR